MATAKRLLAANVIERYIRKRWNAALPKGLMENLEVILRTWILEDIRKWVDKKADEFRPNWRGVKELYCGTPMIHEMAFYQFTFKQAVALVTQLARVSIPGSLRYWYEQRLVGLIQSIYHKELNGNPRATKAKKARRPSG